MTGVKAGGNTFPIGSIFSLNIPFSKDTKDKHATQITLAPGSCLKFNAVHLLPPHDLGSCCTTIYFRTEENPKPMALATFSFEARSHKSLAGLEVCGPRTIRLWLNGSNANLSADLIGSVVSDPNNTLSFTPTPTPTPTPALPSESVTPSSTPTSTNKKKQIENSNHNENDKKEETAKEAEEEALNEKKRKHELHEQKKARKKLAQEKKEQLRHVINEQQGYPENDNDNDNDNDTKKEKEEESKKSKKKGSVSVYSDRRLAGGIVVKDMLIGDGSQVKLGKRASILYTGSFPDGKVFDKNQNKHAPLQFRVGTGEVIRGLERGLEGMRVGGERTITIPPHLGYGKKGSGKVIPKNSTLVFHVKLIGVGSAVNTA